MLPLVVVLVVCALLAVKGVGIYNRLVALKHGAAAAWANIDVLLKQRHSELPKLVEACKQYMQYEQETFERILAARNSVQAASAAQDAQALGTAESALRSGLGKLFALAEAHPDLKANVSFQQLQTRISGLETAISDRRELYNEAVNINNASVEQFPANIVAGMFNFPLAKLLEFRGEELGDVDMKALFRG